MRFLLKNKNIFLIIECFRFIKLPSNFKVKIEIPVPVRPVQPQTRLGGLGNLSDLGGHPVDPGD